MYIYIYLQNCYKYFSYKKFLVFHLSNNNIDSYFWYGLTKILNVCLRFFVEHKSKKQMAEIVEEKHIRETILMYCKIFVNKLFFQVSLIKNESISYIFLF